MSTVTLKLPGDLAARVEAEAKRTRQSKSAVIRRALERSLGKSGGSCMDLAADLVGVVDGPRDLASNPKYMRDFGKSHQNHS